MKISFLVLVVALAAIRSGGGTEPLCVEWTKAAVVGELPVQLRESSGIAASRNFPGRLYHINDSGDAGRFYISTLEGRDLQTVPIADFRPRDTEALSVGPCPGAVRRSCVYVGDIGDNSRRRDTIAVVVVEEMQRFEGLVKAVARLTLRYPDGPHNAESMAVHRDGTLYILTKEQPAVLFRAKVDSGQQTLERVMAVDLESPPTDMAIADDGTRAIVLTYKGAVEFAMDFKERRTVPLLSLPQQESLTYLFDGRSFAFTTERAFPAQPQPIMRQECRSSA